MILMLFYLSAAMTYSAPREIPFSKDFSGDGKPEVARVHLERNQDCENKNLQEMAQKYIELSLSSGKRVLRLAEVCEPFESLESEQDWKYEFKVVVQKKDFGILLVQKSSGDFVGQEYVLAAKDELRVVLEYSHGNFDGQSQFKVEADGNITFRAALGLEAFVEGQRVKLTKASVKKLVCDEKKGKELGFESKFDIKAKVFLSPSPVCI